MATVTFDTLQFVQRLKKAGLKEHEAEAIAEAVRDVRAELEEKVTESNNRLATKQDLTLTETVLRKEIAETKAELVKWVVSIGILQTALIAGLLLRLIPG